ncbi:anti-sigma factor family protein [Lawsonibacter sp. LCP25S3_G6]|uniref:anti-sigma factor family protein n=1 Tax=unclassified Lawsonibacter TaxID=2617946 RepID=UPI003F9C2733
MACQHYYELISQRLDGELTWEEEQELESHLADCPSCRALAEQLSGLHEDFSALEEIPAPEGFAQGVMDRIRMEETKKVIPLFRRPQFKAAAGLAACLVLCAGLYGVGQLNLPVQNGTVQSASATMENQPEDTLPQYKASQAPADSDPEVEDAPGVTGYSFASEEPTVDEPAQSEQIAPKVYGSDNPSQVRSEGKNTLVEAEKPEEEIQNTQLPNNALDSQVPQGDQQDASNGEGQDDPESTVGVTDAAIGEEGEARSFQNEQYLSVTYGATPQAPSAVILGSVQSLTDYLAAFPEDDLTAVAESYDAAYFETGRLLAVVVETGSGSNSFTLAEDGLDAEQVVLEENRPQEGTCDMAAWLIVAEVGTEFSEGETLEVSVVTP